MTFGEIMDRLRGLANAKLRDQYIKNGAGKDTFGVKLGDLRGLAKEIRLNPELANELWRSGNYDAMLLATLLMKPNDLSLNDLERMVASVTNSQIADWLGTNVVKLHHGKETVRERWMASEQEMTARMGWSLTAERVVKDPAGLDLSGLLDRIEREMGSATTAVQWTMNFALGEIGIRNPEYRERVIAIGEKLGAFRDYPTPKGCTSPFVPIWVAEMVRRNGG